MDRFLFGNEATVSSTRNWTSSPAPAPWITFTIGGVLAFVQIIMWRSRYIRLKNNTDLGEGHNSAYTLTIRAMLSAYIDADEHWYTIVKMGAQSFLFLGGIQLDYHITFTVMLIFFAIESAMDISKVLIAVAREGNMREVDLISQDFKDTIDRNAKNLTPSNIFEDLTRSRAIVIMVFMTQFMLISFVVVNTYLSNFHTCLDGMPRCEVGKTLGIWMVYCLGIFMANVYMLGPHSNFGQSEQNPAFWLQLLMTAKEGKKSLSWTQKNGQRVVYKLHGSDWRIWTRLLMSFIINGIGYHILVHALPIQIADSGSLMSIVGTAVGMMYLVDLDDAGGQPLYLIDEGAVAAAAAAAPVVDDDENQPLLKGKKGLF